MKFGVRYYPEQQSDMAFYPGNQDKEILDKLNIQLASI